MEVLLPLSAYNISIWVKNEKGVKRLFFGFFRLFEKTHTFLITLGSSERKRREKRRFSPPLHFSV